MARPVTATPTQHIHVLRRLRISLADFVFLQRSDLPALDLPLDEGKRLFETNFWGTVRMCQVFAPLIIEAKGTIVNIGSVLGELAMPYMCKCFHLRTSDLPIAS
jgi:NAD(P)-dependent dehydrogenase (short-subunit alcohol dehydrogenase family)